MLKHFFVGVRRSPADCRRWFVGVRRSPASCRRRSPNCRNALAFRGDVRQMAEMLLHFAETFAKRQKCSCISRRRSPNGGKALAFRGAVRQMAIIVRDLHGFGRSHRTNLFWGFSRGRRPSIFAADNQHKSFNEHHTKTNPQEMASPIPYIICLCSTRHAGADPSRGLYERR